MLVHAPTPTGWLPPSPPASPHQQWEGGRTTQHKRPEHRVDDGIGIHAIFSVCTTAICTCTIVYSLVRDYIYLLSSIVATWHLAISYYYVYPPALYYYTY